MAAADVGDEQLREDPTVNELQRRAADLLGQEEALFLPTATMANQIALFCQAERGGELTRLPSRVGVEAKPLELWNALL